jgi:hypothetical protein
MERVLRNTYLSLESLLEIVLNTVSVRQAGLPKLLMSGFGLRSTDYVDCEPTTSDVE